MSKHETWRTRKYWESIGGLLIEEFLAIRLNRKDGIGKRLIDGVIVLGEEKNIQIGGQHDIEGKDVIAIQTKSTRLGMYLMGKHIFLEKFLKDLILNQLKQLLSVVKETQRWKNFAKNLV